MLNKDYLRLAKKSFTLVELLVVMAIIMLLTGVAIVNISQARTKARDANRVSDLNTVAAALQLNYADKHVYPTNTDTSSAGFNSIVAQLVTDKYLTTQVIADPDYSTNGYSYYSLDGSVYNLYFTPEEPSKFSLFNGHYDIQNGQICTTATGNCAK